MKTDRFVPESKLVINTVIDEWFIAYCQEYFNNKKVEDLKESLWENLKRFKDLT